MELEKLGKLIDQWKGLLAGIGLLLGAIVTLQKALMDLNPRTSSWAEITVAAVAIVLLGVVTVRSRKAHVSRLVDPDALKMDPQSPEQPVGRRQDLNMLLRALANPLVFLVSESGCGKSALLRAGVAQGPAFTQRFLPIYIDMSVLDWEDGPLRAVREGFAQALPNDDPAQGKLDAPHQPPAICRSLWRLLPSNPAPPVAVARPIRRLPGGAAPSSALPAAGAPRVWRNAGPRSPARTPFGECCVNALQSGGDKCHRSPAARTPPKELESLRFHPGRAGNSTCPGWSRGWYGLIIDRVRPSGRRTSRR